MAIMREQLSARAIALNRTTAGSNLLEYIGPILFPSKKKAGLDLKWIKTHKGLPVSLSPSVFDTVSTIRSREGIKIDKTEMAFFKESMLVKEQDEQDLLRAGEEGDPLLTQALASIYDDVNTLIDGADVVPERMIMQLLSPATGKPGISIAANGATYLYDYDPSGDFQANNFLNIVTATDQWTDTVNSDPVADIEKGMDSVEERTGSKPEIMIVSKKTFNLLKKNAKVRGYLLAQNMTANIMITDQIVKDFFRSALGISIVIYNKKYRDEAGTVKQFYPDGFATLIPSGVLGNTWYGTTPEERVMGAAGVDVAMINNNVSVQVVHSTDPVHTKILASEVVLPSFERMDEVFVIKAF